MNKYRLHIYYRYINEWQFIDIQGNYEDAFQLYNSYNIPNGSVELFLQYNTGTFKRLLSKTY